MAYNLQPLITILQQILNPEQTRWIFYHKKPQLESLLEKAESLQQILENSSFTKIESLESQIRDAAHEAEDIIESHIVDQIHSTPKGGSLTFSTPDLHHVMQQLDSATEQMVKLMEGKTMSKSTSSSCSASFSHFKEGKKVSTGSSRRVDDPFSSSKTDLVGVDGDLMQLKDRLTNTESRLEIIPIVGMGGIGKSALALNLYDDSLILSHFDYRGWAAISQVYNMRDSLLSLLRGPNGKISRELIELNDNELRDILHKRLFGRRYLIVLDDMWSTSFWDEISLYFPDNNNGSRIVITTRELDVAKYVNLSMQHHVRLLNKCASWDLLRQIVFGEEDCPHELQEVGTKIAGDCCGLPLAIHVMGGLLSKVERSRNGWEHMATDVKAALAESDEQFWNILSLSYNHLPIHLKPCFLYMGAFREDDEIKASTLMPLWIAEGFVKSNGDRSLEEEAEDYLKALVERNLLLVPRKKSNGKPMSYAIHDLLRDLCIRKANEEKFLYAENSSNVTFTNERRVCFHSKMKVVYASPQFISLARSFIFMEDEIIFSMLPFLRLLRVLDIMKTKFEEFPREILQLFNLRYLAFSCASGLPIGISRLCNLQTLISKQKFPSLTSELWEIFELRHLRLNKLIQIEEGYKIKFVHKKLQTIYMVMLTPSLIRSGFLETIPNIVKLGIFYVDPPCIEIDLSHLHKLEILLCGSQSDEDGTRFLPKLRLPCNLRKLTLARCVIFQSFLTTLCSLPNLESLKILGCVFESETDEYEDEEWEATEGDEFPSLQLLQLVGLDLVRWRADETNFPRLRQLLVYKCFKLEEIPSAIGDIPTLQEIEIWKCSASVVASAKQIQKVQQDEYDNYDLQVNIS